MEVDEWDEVGDAGAASGELGEEETEKIAEWAKVKIPTSRAKYVREICQAA